MNEELAYICENYKQIQNRVASAAKRAGRDYRDIRVIAVSKNVGEAGIEEAYKCGITEFGENKVQELSNKFHRIGVKCSWHMIGHLQTNKVRHLLDKVTLIHSLDRLELAEEIEKRAKKAERIIEVLVQVNIAEEESKSGIKLEDAIDFVKELAKMRNLKVKGLMTIAPLVENPEKIRWVFAKLRKLLIDIQQENIDNIDMEYLSMGMSNDFELAIEEGSNIVRIGTAIFGERRY